MAFDAKICDNEVHDMIGIDGLFEACMHSVIIRRRES